MTDKQIIKAEFMKLEWMGERVKKSKEHIEEMMKHMTPEQIAGAQKLARDGIAKNINH